MIEAAITSGTRLSALIKDIKGYSDLKVSIPSTIIFLGG